MNITWYVKKNYFDDFHIVENNSKLKFKADSSLSDIKLQLHCEGDSLDKLLVYKAIINNSDIEDFISSREFLGYNKFKDSVDLTLSEFNLLKYNFNELKLVVGVILDSDDLGVQKYYDELNQVQVESHYKDLFESYLILEVTGILN